MAEGQPICLTVPGLGNSTEGHWQTIWEDERADCRRVELGYWNAPVRDIWVARIDAAISFARRPVVLAAHSLGCTAIAWWAAEAARPLVERVRGALLVAPPDLDRPGVPVEVNGFKPTPRSRLPFPAVLVASSDDPYASIPAAKRMATAWGAEFVEAGAHQHMNAAARLGSWRDGQKLLDRLLTRRDGPVGLAV